MMTDIELIDLFIAKLDALSRLPMIKIAVGHRVPVFRQSMILSYWRLIIILSGERLYRYSDGGKTISRVFRAGDVLLVEPFGGVWCEEDGTYEMFSIVVVPSAIRFVAKQRRQGVRQSAAPDAALHGGQSQMKSFQLLLEAMALIIERDISCDIDPLLRFLWNECRVAIHSGIDVPQSGPRHLLNSIVNFIGEHIAEDLGCSRLAMEFGISANYVSQLFLRGMQCGVTEYVQNQRMELARQLLKHSKMNISEIADCCGYQQTNYFIKVFKKQYGCTPLAYRTMQQ